MAEKVEIWIDSQGKMHRTEFAANIADAANAVRDLAIELLDAEPRDSEDVKTLDGDELGEFLLKHASKIAPVLEAIIAVRKRDAR